MVTDDRDFLPSQRAIYDGQGKKRCICQKTSTRFKKLWGKWHLLSYDKTAELSTQRPVAFSKITLTSMAFYRINRVLRHPVLNSLLSTGLQKI